MIEIWVISVRLRMVTVFRSATDSKGYTLARSDSLSCPDLLPGFALALSEVFAGLESNV